MAELFLYSEEWFPVYVPVDSGSPEFLARLDRVELPDDLAQRLRETIDSFRQVQDEVGELMKEQAHQSAVEARRTARGQGKVRRRPRPPLGDR